MFSVMTPPIFAGASAFFRPAVSSPLSSSPTHSSSSPLAPRDPNIPPRREAQSSPLAAPKFRFASRPAKANPLMQKRETAQEKRRNTFLQGVRQRAEDRRWEQRGGEQELLKLEWWSLNRELDEARRTDIHGMVSEAEMEDATQAFGEPSRDDPDEMMVEFLAREEEAELDALLSMLPEPSEPRFSGPTRPESPHLSDDEDYDTLFADYLAGDLSRTDGGVMGMDMS